MAGPHSCSQPMQHLAAWDTWQHLGDWPLLGRVDWRNGPLQSAWPFTKKGRHFYGRESLATTPPESRKDDAPSDCRAALCCYPKDGNYRQHPAISLRRVQRYKKRREPGSRRIALTHDFRFSNGLARLRNADHPKVDSLPKSPSDSDNHGF